MRAKQRLERRSFLRNKHKIWISFGLTLCGVVLSVLARYIDGFADGYYTYIYRYLSVVLAFIWNLVPFSVAEVILYVAGIAFIGSILYGLLVMIRRKGHRKSYWLKVGCNFILTITATFFLFVIFCGVNYQKTSFAVKEGFSKKQYDIEDLSKVCRYLTEEINLLSENEIVYTDIREDVRRAMLDLSDTYRSLQGYYPKPKYLIFPELLSYQQISGVYSFYTIEANYNSDMVDYQQPFTMCHELAHLKGVMREEEASFVAYLACINSNQPELKYSGAMVAYAYCMTELYEGDREEYIKIRKQLSETAGRDIKLKQAFWKKYEGAISAVQTKVNDAYLKANAQALGVSSYDEVTALIVNDYINQIK